MIHDDLAGWTARLPSRTNPVCRIHLLGPFAAFGEDGRDLTPKSRKSCAILAMLALAPRGVRSRVWLRDKLWSDRHEEQASASLRQALAEIRRITKVHCPELLCFDKHTVSMNLDRVEVDLFRALARGGRDVLADRPLAELLLEGLDLRDPEFEEWLALERQAWQRRFDEATDLGEGHDGAGEDRPMAAPREPRARRTGGKGSANGADGAGSGERAGDGFGAVALAAPVVAGDAGSIPSVVRNLAAVSLLDSGEVRLYDLSMLPPASLRPFGRASENAGAVPEGIRVLLQPKVECTRSSACVTMTVLDAEDTATAWVGDCLVERAEIEGGCPPALHDLVVRATAATLRALDLVERGGPGEGLPRLSKAIDAMFRLDREDLDRAERILREHIRTRPTSLTRAWLAFLLTFRVGQRFSSNDAPLIEEAQALSRQALEGDPRSPTVAALVGHVHSFLFAEYDFAAGLFERSLRLNPAQPLGWDLYAMLHAYAGQPRRALAMADWAVRLGEFTPHRYYFETTRCISASFAGDPRTALAAGRAGLVDRPGYNSLLRMVVSSLGHLGQKEAARAALDRLEAAEPGFSVQSLRDARYPGLETEGGRFFVDGLLKAGARVG